MSPSQLPLLLLLLLLHPFPPFLVNAAEKLPFPPSVLSIPHLKLIEYNGRDFELQCELGIATITQPVTYRWFYSHTVDGTGKELPAGATELHVVAGPKLTVSAQADWQFWDDLTGYYWCMAENVHGKSTSNLCWVHKTTGSKSLNRDTPEFSVASGQSVRLQFAHTPVTEESVPLDVSFEVIKESDTVINSEKNELVPGRRFNGGRWVIARNNDIYVLEAQGEDNGLHVQQRFTEFSAYDDFMTQEASIIVTEDPFAGDLTGFFTEDFLTKYLFVRNRKHSWFSCIPKKHTLVSFRKDGEPLEVPYEKDKYMTRADYHLFFERPRDSDSGRYQCVIDEHPDQTVTYDVKVIGEPTIVCDFQMMIIRPPGEPLRMSCDVTSPLMDLDSPDVFVDDEPIVVDGTANYTLSSSSTRITDGYKVVVESRAVREEDTCVVRIHAHAPRLSKQEVISRSFRGVPAEQVFFDDYLILEYESKQEVSIAVFVMPVEILGGGGEFNVLMGSQNYRLVMYVVGSPIPTIEWRQDDTPIPSDHPDFTQEVKYSAMYRLYIKNVERSANYTITGTNFENGQPIKASRTASVIAHQPIVFGYDGDDRDAQLSQYAIISEDKTIECRAKQREGVNTGELVISWYRGDNVMNEPRENGHFVDEQNGHFIQFSRLRLPVTETEETVTCQVKLVVAGTTLQTEQFEYTVLGGPKPRTPQDLQLDESGQQLSWRSWRSMMPDKWMADVVEHAVTHLGEREPSDEQWTVLGQVLGGSTSVKLQETDVQVTLAELAKQEGYELEPGADHWFRAYSRSLHGDSDFSNQVEGVRTPDAPPSQQVTNLQIHPVPNSGLINVTWDRYPESAYNAYDPSKCCIKLRVTIAGEEDMIEFDCLDRGSTGKVVGRPDTPAYTLHWANVLFENQGGQTEATFQEGYNRIAAPPTPLLDQDMIDVTPTSITVNVPAMGDSDLAGPFGYYEVVVRDEEGNEVGRATSRERGQAPDTVPLTVDGLDPFSEYEVQLVVANDQYSSGSDPLPVSTPSTQPAAVPEPVFVHVYPDGVVFKWEPVTEVNGRFENYELRFPADVVSPALNQTGSAPAAAATGAGEAAAAGGGGRTVSGYTDETVFNATELLFPRPSSAAEGPFSVDVICHNSDFSSQPTSTNVDLEMPPDVLPEEPGVADVQCVEGELRMSASWSHEQWGKFAEWHSLLVVMRRPPPANTTSGLGEGGEGRRVCEATGLLDPQTCSVPLESAAAAAEGEPTEYEVFLVASNQFGSTQSSQSVPCNITYIPPITEMQEEGDRGAGWWWLPYLLLLMLLLLLLLLVLLLVVYYANNRSHQYRVARNEAKYRPSDVQFLPLKDDTHCFAEFVPDALPPVAPSSVRPGLVDVDNDSFVQFGDDDDIEGYGEDGSFIGAYVNDYTI